MAVVAAKEQQLKNMQDEFSDKSTSLNKLEEVLAQSKLLQEDLEHLRKEKQTRDEEVEATA